MNMDGKVKEQILAVRDSGLTNMLDVVMVQRIAFERGYYELVNFIEENRSRYVHFIFNRDGEGTQE